MQPASPTPKLARSSRFKIILTARSLVYLFYNVNRWMKERVDGSGICVSVCVWGGGGGGKLQRMQLANKKHSNYKNNYYI